MLNGWWGSSDRNKYIADKRKDCRSAIKNTKSLQQAFYCCCLCMYRSPWLVCCWCRCRKKCNSFFECRSRFKSDYLLVKFYLKSNMNTYFISPNRIILTNLVTYNSTHVKYYLLQDIWCQGKCQTQRFYWCNGCINIKFGLSWNWVQSISLMSRLNLLLVFYHVLNTLLNDVIEIHFYELLVIPNQHSTYLHS